MRPLWMSVDDPEAAALRTPVLRLAEQALGATALEDLRAIALDLVWHRCVPPKPYQDAAMRRLVAALSDAEIAALGCPC